LSLFCISFLKPMLLPTLRLSTTLPLCFRSLFLLPTHNGFGSFSFQLYKSIFYFSVFICIYSFQPTLPWVLTHGIYPWKHFTLLYQIFSLHDMIIWASSYSCCFISSIPQICTIHASINPPIYRHNIFIFVLWWTLIVSTFKWSSCPNAKFYPIVFRYFHAL